MASQLTGKRARLAAAVDRAVNVDWCERPFVWGATDCLLSLADILREALGYDPAADWRGRYTTLRGALRVTRDVGGFAGALRRVACHYRWPPIDPAAARIGDIGLVRTAAGLRVGAIRFHWFWVARRDGCGFVAFRGDEIEMAWRVR